MHIHILTLFPDMFTGPFDSSIIKRAQTKNLVTIQYYNIRDFANDSYKTVDGHPYGGGVGMVLRVDVIDRALQHVRSQIPNNETTRIILLDAGGTPYVQDKAQSLTTFDHLILIAAHYEGVDERVRTLVNEEISIGDYVLTGGELPAMVIIDSVTRLLPGVLAKSDAVTYESFAGEEKLLEYPQYTEPRAYEGHEVPEILLSGNHAKINEWRDNESKKKTKLRRPDLLK